MIKTIENRSVTGVEFDREDFFEDLYLKVFPSVANFVRKQNGTLDDAKDVFHDALIIFYEKKMDECLEVRLSDEAYIFGIVKHLWIKKARANQRVLLTERESLITLPDDFEPNEQSVSILSFLRSAGEKCMALLQAFYYEKKPLDVITSAFGFSTIRSATVQKYKCLEKVRDSVKSKSKNYEDFIS